MSKNKGKHYNEEQIDLAAKNWAKRQHHFQVWPSQADPNIMLAY